MGIWRGLRRDDRSHRRLQVHRDNGDDYALNRLHGKRTAVLAADFPGDAEDKAGGSAVAAGGMNFSDANNTVANLQKQRVTSDSNPCRAGTGCGLQKEVVVARTEEQRCYVG